MSSSVSSAYRYIYISDDRLGLGTSQIINDRRLAPTRNRRHRRLWSMIVIDRQQFTYNLPKRESSSPKSPLRVETMSQRAHTHTWSVRARIATAVIFSFGCVDNSLIAHPRLCQASCTCDVLQRPLLPSRLAKEKKRGRQRRKKGREREREPHVLLFFRRIREVSRQKTTEAARPARKLARSSMHVGRLRAN